MTLTCVWFTPPLKCSNRISGRNHEIVSSFTEALRIFVEAEDDVNVLRAYNSACSVWIGRDLKGSLIMASSRFEFMRLRCENGGVKM